MRDEAALKWLQAAALTTVALWLPEAGFAAKAELNAEVPASNWRALRLNSLPKDASIAVRVETTGPIVVIFARQTDRATFPQVPNAAFAGTAEHSLSFRVAVPESGNYYIILDNRKGADMRKVRILIDARPAPAAPKSSPRPPAGRLDAT